MADERPESFLDTIERIVSTNLKKIYKTRLGIPFVVVFGVAVFYAMLVYVGGTCLVGLIPPLLLIWLLWTMGERNFRKLVVIGLIVAVTSAAVEVLFIADYYVDANPEPIDDTEGAEGVYRMVGSVTPTRGDSSLVYEYTVIIYTPVGAVVEPVNLTVVGYHGSVFTNSGWELTHDNYTMALVSNTSTEWVYNASLTVSQPVNGYVFSTNITLSATTTFFQRIASGPISQDYWAIAEVMTMTAVLDAFVRLFVIYGLIVFIIWWTRKARNRREEAISKWEAERKKIDQEVSKDEKKVPSLQEAMGVDTGSKDSFVCSECGADVPSDATVCPKCGEKFD